MNIICATREACVSTGVLGLRRCRPLRWPTKKSNEIGTRASPGLASEESRVGQFLC